MHAFCMVTVTFNFKLLHLHLYKVTPILLHGCLNEAIAHVR